MKTFVIKHSFGEFFTSHGWGNGYVIIPEGHPLHGLSYDEIESKYAMQDIKEMNNINSN